MYRGEGVALAAWRHHAGCNWCGSVGSRHGRAGTRAERHSGRSLRGVRVWRSPGSHVRRDVVGIARCGDPPWPPGAPWAGRRGGQYGLVKSKGIRNRPCDGCSTESRISTLAWKMDLVWLPGMTSLHSDISLTEPYCTEASPYDGLRVCQATRETICERVAWRDKRKRLPGREPFPGLEGSERG
jgi:hypothetical protein